MSTLEKACTTQDSLTTHTHAHSCTHTHKAHKAQKLNLRKMLFTLQLYIGLQNIEANNFLEIRGNAFSYEGNFFGKSMDSDNFQYLSHYKLLII